MYILMDSLLPPLQLKSFSLVFKKLKTESQRAITRYNLYKTIATVELPTL